MAVINVYLGKEGNSPVLQADVYVIPTLKLVLVANVKNAKIL